MARRKNSTALFEVIQAGRKLEPKPAASKSAAGWWFGRKDKSAAAAAPAAAVDPDDPTANVTAATLFQSRQRPIETTPPVEAAPPEPTPPPARDPYEDTIPVHVATPAPALPAVFNDDPADAADAADNDAPPASRAIIRRPGVQMDLDGDRQEVTVRMRYTTAAVSGFIVLLVVGLAYVVGRHMAEGPASARADNAPSTEKVKKGPAQPAAMDVGPRPTRTALSKSGGDPAGRTTTPPAPVNGADAGDGNRTYVDAVINRDGTCRRTNHLNYILMQRYPLDMRQTARDVAAFMTANGIPCTVERGSPQTGSTENWYCVVGTRGFPPRYGNSADYIAYARAVEAAGAKFPAKSNFEKIQPRAFKWKE